MNTVKESDLQCVFSPYALKPHLNDNVIIGNFFIKRFQMVIYLWNSQNFGNERGVKRKIIKLN